MTQERPALMRMGSDKYTWDDTVAAIGKDYSGGKEHTGQETIDPSSVIRYCEVWEYGNLIYWDKSVAQKAGYKNIVVPWSAVKQTFTSRGFWRPGDTTRFPADADINAMTGSRTSDDDKGEDVPMPPVTQVIVTDVSIEFFEPTCVGDRLTTKGDKLANVRVRKTRIGNGAFINKENEIYNQDGKLVARVNQGMYSYNPE